MRLGAKSYELPAHVGTEEELAVDIGALRAQSGAITLDQSYGNTGSCKSSIAFIDGDKGILRYRGYPFEELAERATFLGVSFPTNMFTVLVAMGRLPGWIAQRKEMIAQDTRIGRPRQLYTGATKRPYPER